ASEYEKELHGSTSDALVGTSLNSLRDATVATLVVLHKVWERFPPEEVSRTPPVSRVREYVQDLVQRYVAKGSAEQPAAPTPPTPVTAAGARDRDDGLGPAREWVRLAENFVATQIVLYVSQFFVHLRNLLLSVTVGTLLLLLAATSYPFQP